MSSIACSSSLYAQKCLLRNYFRIDLYLFIKLIPTSADNTYIDLMLVNVKTVHFNFLLSSLTPKEGITMHMKFLESIGVSGIDFTKYPVEHLPRILHLSMIIKNTCFWMNDAVVPYRLLSQEEQTKILEEYVQCIIAFQFKET